MVSPGPIYFCIAGAIVFIAGVVLALAKRKRKARRGFDVIDKREKP